MDLFSLLHGMLEDQDISDLIVSETCFDLIPDFFFIIGKGVLDI